MFSLKTRNMDGDDILQNTYQRRRRLREKQSCLSENFYKINL